VPGYNRRVDLLRESPTRRIDALRERLRGEGRDILLLSTGQPGVPPPVEARRWLAERLVSEEGMGLYGYTPSAGRRGLLEAIALDLEELGGFQVSVDQLVATAGGQEALFAVLQTIIEPGDPVLVLDPMYFGYWPLLDYAGARVARHRLDPSTGFQVDAERLAQDIAEQKPKAVILVTPDNPTGRVLDRPSLERIAEAAVEAGSWLVVDEAYRTLVYEGDYAHAYPLAPENTIAIGTFSKDPGIPGWRLGYVYGPQWIIRKVRLVSEEIVYCPPLPAQELVRRYLEDRETRHRHLEYIRRVYRERRDALLEAIQTYIPGARPTMPGGGMFTLLDLSPLLGGADAEKVAVRLLEEQSVATVPGSYFGETAKTALRLSFAAEPPERLREAARRIGHVVASMRGV